MAAAAMRRFPGGEGLTLAALCVLAAALFVLPLALLFAQAAPDQVAAALDSRAVRRALWNSLDSAAWSAVLATAIGTTLALAVALTDIRAKGPATFLILLPMMIPPHVTAIAWTQLLGPASPVLGPLGLAPPPGTSSPLYSRAGVIGLLALQHAPLVFLVLLAALRALPREGVKRRGSRGQGRCGR